MHKCYAKSAPISMSFFAWECTQAAYVAFAQSRVWVRLATASSSMFWFVCMIVGSRVPSKIGQAVVASVAVVVTRFMPLRLLSNKSSQYKTVDVKMSVRGVAPKVGLYVPIWQRSGAQNAALELPHAPVLLRKHSWFAANSPEVAHRVQAFVSDDRQPTLYNLVSHAASVTGQVVRSLGRFTVGRGFAILGEN